MHAALVRILSHATTVSTVAPTLATMIGLGVGIDYALFIVTRHLRGIDQGLDWHESIARATATSGGAVVLPAARSRSRSCRWRSRTSRW